MGGKYSEKWNIHEYADSLDLTLPPLSVLVLKHANDKKPEIKVSKPLKTSKKKKK